MILSPAFVIPRELKQSLPLTVRDVSTPLDMTIEMQPMQVRAPAKINLSLRVVGKRPDGFHEIETLIAPVTLFDTIEIAKQPRWIDFSCDDPTVPGGDENLVVRAARLFFDRTSLKSGVSIKLEKKIPHGAGLGGGSSDAASTLLALNQLFETKLTRPELAKLAAEIGSDVAFFIFESAAVCRGRGEDVQPTAQPAISVLLLKPPFAVATASAYARWRDSRELPGVNYEPQIFYGTTLVNHLERPVFEKFVFLATMKRWLIQQPEVGGALMSGSGSTMFGVLRGNADAGALAARAKDELDPQLWTCACETGGSSSPLLDAQSGGGAAII